jgi:arsenite oxidase large subunit
MNLTSMNGERRMRITERYMDPPGQALPDCLIVARLAQALEKSWRVAGKNDIADKFVNTTWQSSYLDQQNEFVMDRWPFPFIQIHPDDMKELDVMQGDLVEVYNDNGSTQAMVQPGLAAVRRKETFMLFAQPNGVMGNVVSKGVNEFIIPNYKQAWANIRKITSAPEAVRHLSFKSFEYSVG